MVLSRCTDARSSGCTFFNFCRQSLHRWSRIEAGLASLAEAADWKEAENTGRVTPAEVGCVCGGGGARLKGRSMGVCGGGGGGG